MSRPEFPGMGASWDEDPDSGSFLAFTCLSDVGEIMQNSLDLYEVKGLD